MSRHALRTALLAGVLALGPARAVMAQEYDQSSTYDAPFGMSAGEENDPITTTNGRDENGNKVMVNGQNAGPSYSKQTGVRQSGTGAAYGGATAIGNSLNVTVQGHNNTVIVNSKQVNNGDQNAGVSLNGELKL